MREPHMPSFISGRNRFESIEVVSENYLFGQSEKRDFLIDLSKRSFTHLHAVSGNLGSFDPIDGTWLTSLKTLAEQTSAQLISDHLCFTKLNNQSSFELLPVPMTPTMIDHIGQRVERVQEALGTQFLLENISRYFAYKGDQMSEVEFMNQLHDKYGVCFLLDINNIFVSAQNLNFSPEAFVDTLNPAAVKAFHIGGFEIVSGFHFDTHGAAINGSVKKLFSQAVKRFGKVPTFLERDENIPEDLTDLEDELLGLIEGMQ